MKKCEGCGGLKFEDNESPSEYIDCFEEWCKCWVRYRDLVKEAFVDSSIEAPTRNIDYRKILGAYICYVGYCEGTDFLTSRADNVYESIKGFHASPWTSIPLLTMKECEALIEARDYEEGDDEAPPEVCRQEPG